ncbi:hypothetical protein DFH11DRAFT_1139074 [Phellopilus nigrolimitatus]|nr:hypothetical protein DFH11DRAFT_1139074 [Phellopilus nigrolimitatus]
MSQSHHHSSFSLSIQRPIEHKRNRKPCSECARRKMKCTIISENPRLCEKCSKAGRISCPLYVPWKAIRDNASVYDLAPEQSDPMVPTSDAPEITFNATIPDTNTPFPVSHLEDTRTNNIHPYEYFPSQQSPSQMMGGGSQMSIPSNFTPSFYGNNGAHPSQPTFPHPQFQYQPQQDAPGGSLEAAGSCQSQASVSFNVFPPAAETTEFGFNYDSHLPPVRAPSHNAPVSGIMVTGPLSGPLSGQRACHWDMRF